MVLIESYVKPSQILDKSSISMEVYKTMGKTELEDCKIIDFHLILQEVWSRNQGTQLRTEVKMCVEL